MRVSHLSQEPHNLKPEPLYVPRCSHIHTAFLYLGPSTSFCSSNKYGSKPGTPASTQKKPAEVSYWSQDEVEF